MKKHNKQQRRPVALAITMTLAPQYGATEPDAPVVLPEITVTGAPPDTIGYKTTRATTATKTDTPIFDLPVSIQVLPTEVLDDRQVILLQDALETVSGVVPFAGGGSAFDTPRIRGFEAFRNVYRDGFRGRFFGNYIHSMAHLERVEVLKGPASVLYGRMEPGGLPWRRLIIPCSSSSAPSISTVRPWTPPAR